MNDFDTLCSDGLDEAQEVCGSDFTWKRTTYRGVYSEYDVDQAMLDSGYEDKGIAAIVANRAQFTGTLPVARESVTVDGRTFKILRVSQDSTSVTLQLQRIA